MSWVEEERPGLKVCASDVIAAGGPRQAVLPSPLGARSVSENETTSTSQRVGDNHRHKAGSKPNHAVRQVGAALLGRGLGSLWVLWGLGCK